MSNWYTTFQAASGTIVNDGNHTYIDNSSHVYDNLFGQSNVPAVIVNNSLYSSYPGSGACVISNTPMGLNDPITMQVKWNGNTSRNFGIFTRCQSTGASLFWNVNNGNNVSFYYIDSAAVGHFLNSTPMPTLTNGHNYLISAVSWNILHFLYIYDINASQWCNQSGTFQAAQTWFSSRTSNGILVPGSGGLYVSAASNDANAPAITAVSGGPEVIFPSLLNLVRTSDTVVDLYTQSQFGGVSPVTYSLQRQLGAGSYSTVASITPGQYYFDNTVSPSSSYNYRIAGTDAELVTTYSNTVNVNTLGSNTVTPYALGTPSLSQLVNGVQWKDTAGNSMVILHHRAFYDSRYDQHFLVCDGGVGNALPLYVSKDVINWTPLGNVFSGLTIQGHGYDYINECNIIPHPTNGMYYLFFTGLNTSTGHSDVYIYRGPTPLTAGSSYIAGPISLPGGSTYAYETDYWLDPGTSRVWVGTALIDSRNNNLQSVVACSVNSNWNGFNSASYIIASGYQNAGNEGPSFWRRDRTTYIVSSRLTGYAWNANYMMVATALDVGQSITPDTNFTSPGWQLYTNHDVFITPATIMAEPAGAGPPTYPYGYGGTDVAGSTGYSGGTSIGIDPAASYSTQSWSSFSTNNNQIIQCTTRWDAAGDNNSSVVWLLPQFDTYGQPTIPFTASFIPSVLTAGGGSTLSPPKQFYGGPPFSMTPATGNPIHLLTGGIIFAGGSLKSTASLRTLNWPYQGLRNQYNESKSPQGASVSTGLASGQFSSMVHGEYVILTFNHHIAAVPTTILVSPGHADGVSQNLEIGWVNTRQINTGGGFWMMNGLPINPVYTRDNIGKDKYPGSRAVPGRLTTLPGGKLPSIQTLNTKDD